MGKSTTAVNLAYTLAQMGAKVGIFDADVYGPSLPTMVSPKNAVLAMDPATKHITPTEYEGVKLVSFGFAGQGSAIMRGAMVSGVLPSGACHDSSYCLVIILCYPILYYIYVVMLCCVVLCCVVLCCVVLCYIIYSYT